jgi:acid phosphatase family membrane protein YuiD
LIYNPYIVVPAATWAVAQVAKFALAAFRGRLDFRYLYASGGMPSVHSAVVSSLAATAFLVDGYGSHLFGFAVITAFIVMYDSFGVRRSAGEQGTAINMLISSLDRGKIRLDTPSMKIRETLGHQPEEVTIGAVLGILLACIFNYDKLGAVGSFLQGYPLATENNLYFAVAVVLIVGTIAQRIIISRRSSVTLQTVSRQSLAVGQTIGWITLIGGILIYERASYLAWRMWVIVVLALGVVWFASLVARWRPRLRTDLHAERELARKGKWLQFGRRKRKK